MRHAKPAESLIETMVAITVIVLATTAALSVLRTATQGNEVIGRKTIAVNLALEGFEALRNIRDTNYLRLSSDPDSCWNTLGVTDVADCPTAAVIRDGWTYYLTREYSADPMFEWDLVRLTNYSTQGFMDLYDVDLDGDSTDDSKLFAQSLITSVSNMSAPADDRRLYQRYISIEYVSADAFEATVTVRWYERSTLKTLTLTRTIANVY